MASHVLQGMARANACVTRHAKANACVTHGKPCVHMHANGHATKMGGQFVKEGRSRKERRRKKKRERKERKKEREKEKKGRERRRKGNLRSNGRNSLDQGVKSEGYTLKGRYSSYFGLFSTIRVVGLCLCPKGMFGRILKNGNATLF